MKHKEIKIGGVYDVRVKVIKKMDSDLSGQVEIGAYTMNRATNSPMQYEMSWFLAEESPAFVEVTPENGVKNSEPAPKYDPCRMFKEGDIVAPQEVNGRIFSGAVEELIGQNCVVVEDELVCCNVRIRHGEDEYTIDTAYLELVTPVEELGPYIVRHNKAHAAWSIYGPFDLSAVNYFYGERYPYTSETAKHAAEAECARLNAEYRKEQK